MTKATFTLWSLLSKSYSLYKLLSSGSPNLVCDGGCRLPPGQHGQRREDGPAVPLARRGRVKDGPVATEGQ